MSPEDKLAQIGMRVLPQAPPNKPPNGADYDGAQAPSADVGGTRAETPHDQAASLPATPIVSGPPSAKEFLRSRKLANLPAGAAEADLAAVQHVLEEGLARQKGNGAAPPASVGEADGGAPPAQAPPDDKPLPKLVPIRFVEGELPKPREWIVHDGWIPTRKVTLLQGDGGDGKTPLVQQLLSSCATALPWLGLRVEECAGLGFFTEDEDRDIRLRQADIDASYGRHCASTGKMHLFPRVDEDNELVVFDNRGKPSLTPFYRQVRESALDLRARLIALDIAVDLFGGDEISRRHVRGFMRPLGALAREIDGAVVMTAHVSQAGIKSDGGHSGSTDWSNGPRGRLYLGRPKAENGEATDPNARILTRKKANFSTVGETVKLHWERGLIVPDAYSAPSFPRPVDDVFLALLDAMTAEGQNVSPKKKAGNCASALFMTRPPKDRGGYQRADFDRAMQSLLKDRKIKIVPYGPPSADTQKLVRVDDGGLS